MRNVRRLQKIGFELVGVWQLDDHNKLIIELTNLAEASNILYAFVCEGEVKYIGKTVQPLKKRMYGYQHPGPTQRTNIKNNKRIIDLILVGKVTQVYALPDNGQLCYGEYKISLAAGLEDSLITEIKPDWNDMGK